MTIPEAIEEMDREFRNMSPDEMRAYFDAVEPSHEFDEFFEMQEFFLNREKAKEHCAECWMFMKPEDELDFERGKSCFLGFRSGECPDGRFRKMLPQSDSPFSCCKPSLFTGAPHVGATIKSDRND